MYILDHRKDLFIIRYLFILFVALFSSLKLYAKEYVFEDIEWITTLSENYSFTNGIYCESICDLNENWTELKGKYRIYEENSYLMAEIQFKDFTSKYFVFSANDKHLILYDTYRNKQIECTNSKYHIDEPWIWPISQCAASSFLVEKLKNDLVEYKPENLTDKDISKNWVEGTEGLGIGESFTIKNDILPARKFYIINGFFCPDKTSLFYSNGRVRKLLMECLSSNGVICKKEEIILEDTGKLQEIDTKGKYDFITFTIMEVYPGMQYQDTAISSIFVDGLSAL